MLEKTLESALGCKEIQPVHPKGNQPWLFIERTAAEAETPILWPPDVKSWPWCWERLRAGGEGDDRGGDGWMASLTQWTWVGANSGRQWRTGKPGVLQSMGLQRVRPNGVTEQQQQNMLKSTDLSYAISSVASTQSSSSHKLVWLHCQHLTFSSIRVRSNSGGLWCQDQGLASFLWKGPNCKYFKF